jgi:hypothetical protein
MLSGYVAVAAYISYLTKIHVDTLAALSILVAVASLILWFNNGNAKFIEFYNTALNVKDPVAVAIIDFVIHYLPAILLGLPHNSYSYIKAYFVLLAYYVLMRNHLNSIYFGAVSPEWVDPYILGAGVIIGTGTLFSKTLPT